MKTFKQFLAEDDDYFKPTVSVSVIVKAVHADEDYLDRPITKALSKIDSSHTEGLNFRCGEYERIDDNGNFRASLYSPVVRKFDFNKFDPGKVERLINEEFSRSGERIKLEFGAGIFRLKLYRVPEFAISVHACSFIGQNLDGSLIGIHKTLKAHHIDVFSAANIKRGGLGLLMIKGLKTLKISNNIGLSQATSGWGSIVKKHFMHDKSLLACQEELIDAGFEENAEL